MEDEVSGRGRGGSDGVDPLQNAQVLNFAEYYKYSQTLRQHEKEIQTSVRPALSVKDLKIKNLSRKVRVWSHPVSGESWNGNRAREQRLVLVWAADAV